MRRRIISHNSSTGEAFAASAFTLRRFADAFGACSSPGKTGRFMAPYLRIGPFVKM